jgi:hypothetical protein
MKAKWLTYCGLTCMGGSERKECPCSGPRTCELRNHPEFDEARARANNQMLRHLRNKVRRKLNGDETEEES